VYGRARSYAVDPASIPILVLTMEYTYVIGATDASLCAVGYTWRSTPMSEAKPDTCYLCSKNTPHSPGTSIVEVTFERDGLPRVFHLNCFVAFTTGTPRDRNIWTYRIVATPASRRSPMLAG